MESRNKEIIPENEIIETEASQNEASEIIAENEEKQEKKPLIVRIKECELFNTPFRILCFASIGAIIIYVLSRFVPFFAEIWTRFPAQALRFLLAKITGWIPFSLAEALLVSLPVIAIGYMIASSVSTKRDESNYNYYRWLRPLISCILVILTIFLGAFGPAYGRNKLAVNLGLEQKPVSSDELYSTGAIVGDELTEFVHEVDFDASGASIMPYDYDTLVEKMNDAFRKYASEADYISHFNSRPKPIALSKPMTYTHISGVYTFMTGESNINTNYPDFLIPFTMAHEMAHQRGIAREDEANFVAFLVCIGSDDAYIRYSGYTNMANYISNALHSADYEKYVDMMVNHYPTDVMKEFSAYSDFFDEYRDSTASEVTGAVNNAFLQSQGQSAGTKSYGLVVDLAVAYYK